MIQGLGKLLLDHPLIFGYCSQLSFCPCTMYLLVCLFPPPLLDSSFSGFSFSTSFVRFDGFPSTIEARNKEFDLLFYILYYFKKICKNKNGWRLEYVIRTIFEWRCRIRTISTRSEPFCVSSREKYTHYT